MLTPRWTVVVIGKSRHVTTPHRVTDEVSAHVERQIGHVPVVDEIGADELDRRKVVAKSTNTPFNALPELAV